MQCNAKNRKGVQCTKHALPGKTKCRYHGGLTPSGTASPHWKTGRYSKYLPAELLNKYNEARRDPDLLNLRDEISLVDARLKQLIEKLPQGGASHSWKDLGEVWPQFINIQLQINAAKNDQARQALRAQSAEVLRRLNEIITDGAQEAGVWEDIITHVDNRRKLSASEAKRLTDMQQTITAEKAMALVYAVLDIIRRNIIIYRDEKRPADDKLLSIIAEGVRGLVTIPARVLEDDNR